MSTRGLLRYALLAGAGYFVAMATAHWTSFKFPLLFIYYDVPFYEYQDKIIAFCAFTYACLFYSASQHLVSVPAALVSLGATVLGLSAVNMSSALGIVLHGRSTQAYWLQTGFIAAYWAVLFALYSRAASSHAKRR